MQNATSLCTHAVIAAESVATAQVEMVCVMIWHRVRALMPILILPPSKYKLAPMSSSKCHAGLQITDNEGCATSLFPSRRSFPVNLLTVSGGRLGFSLTEQIWE